MVGTDSFVGSLAIGNMVGGLRASISLRPGIIQRHITNMFFLSGMITLFSVLLTLSDGGLRGFVVPFIVFSRFDLFVRPGATNS